MIDLHVHSCRSDGTMTPTELVDYAKEKQLSAFALTDHDTVNGIDEALNRAKELKEKGIADIKVIPGIELSTEMWGKDIHIVGLFIDKECPEFKAYLKEFVDARDTRNKTMCEKLVGDGIDVPYDELEKFCGGAVITRAHVAAFMLKKGIVKSRREAFDRFIGDGKPYHIPRKKVTPMMGVELILKAGGVPVFAHPVLTGFSHDKLESLVASLKDAGLMGIEAVYSTYTPSDERDIRNLAAKYHLLISGGSDFHGSNKEDIDLGIGRGKLYVDESVLEDIEAARKKVLFTDLDGTLLLSDSTISDKMRESIYGAVSRGNHIVLASGRPLDSILEVATDEKILFKNMFIISNNGALIYDCDKKCPIYENKVPSEIIGKIVKLADELGVHVQGYSRHEIVSRKEDEEVIYYRKRIHLPLKLVDNIEAELTNGSYKVQLICLDDHEKLEKLLVNIMSELGDVVEGVFSNPRYLEILPKGINKGNALLFIERWLPVAHSATYAAGDAGNDLGMITAAGVGVAMKNATDDVKKAADIVTVNDNDHDGLCEILDSFK